MDGLSTKIEPKKRRSPEEIELLGKLVKQALIREQIIEQNFKASKSTFQGGFMRFEDIKAATEGAHHFGMLYEREIIQLKEKEKKQELLIKSLLERVQLRDQVIVRLKIASEDKDKLLQETLRQLKGISHE